MKQRRQSWLLAYALLLPSLVGLGMFVVYPAVLSLKLSFYEVDPFTQAATYTGLANFTALFHSLEYWQSLQTTLLFLVATVIPSVVISLVVASILAANPYCRGLLRTIFLLPLAISSAMAAMVWIFLYNPTVGYLSYVLECLGISGPNWLGDPRWALVAVAIATVWKEIGFNVIFFLAGLAGMRVDLREAATIDGANAWQRYWHITLPLLSPTIFFVSVVAVINSLQSFGQIHILTGGGPAGATNTLVYNLYRDGFVNFRTGYASAQAVCLFLVMLLATVAQFYFAKKRVHYG